MRLNRRKLGLMILGGLLGNRKAKTPNTGENFLQDVRLKFKVPAVAAACIVNDKLVFAEAVGTRKYGSEEPVSVDDAFHIGSCTKAMTATVLARLVEEGKLSWETKVADVFPDLAEKIHPTFRSVTLFQLLSHRAGLPDDTKPDNEIFPRLQKLSGPLPEQRRLLVELALSRPPAYEPNSQMVYSNFGYVVAAAMAEAVTQSSWEDLMKSLLFEPLGMKTAGVGAPEKVWGHRHLLALCYPIPPSPKADNPLVLVPAGGIHCSVKDWAKFATLHLQGAQGRTKLMSRENFKRLHEDHYRQGYALGWVVVERKWANGIALTHAGSNTFWFAVIWLAPNRNAGFVAATNCGGEHAFQACDAAIAGMVKRFL